MRFYFFFFNDTATTEIYTLSLHDALPISDEVEHAVHAAAPSRGRVDRSFGHGDVVGHKGAAFAHRPLGPDRRVLLGLQLDRKSTRLNSSHANISYAVFCLKKKKNTQLAQV